MRTLTWVEIDRQALRHNVRFFKKAIGRRLLFPVVKSNAYGHGVQAVVSALEKESAVSGFMVASLDEAVFLVTRKRRIVLSMWQRDPRAIIHAVRKKVELPVYDHESAVYLAAIGRRYRLRIPVHLKFDVGTSRIGYRWDDAPSWESVLSSKYVLIKGIFSHFADSESADQSFTKVQNDRFASLVARVRAADPQQRIMAHIACTAATLKSDAYRYDAARVGIGTYGLWPSQESKTGDRALRPVLAWKTRILQIKGLKQGDTVGYGMSYRAPGPMRIAILPVGYWDGYDRSLSNRAEVLIGGRRCPVRGRICMNLMMVELPAKLAVKAYDEVVLIGSQGRERITAEEIARRADTINYEVVTRINPLLPRIVV